MTDGASQPGPRTYAVGDIHGEVTLLRHLIAMLPLMPDDTLVFLGDYLDYGEDSAATIAYLRDLSERHYCIFLRGNHEETWLREWDGTHFTRQPHSGGARKAWLDFGKHPPVEVGQWLAATRPEYEDVHGYYAHAGAEPGKPFAESVPWFKVWGSPAFFTSDYDWGKPLVFGHYPMPSPLLWRHRVGIDTGARNSGILTAVRLPDRAIFQARRDSMVVR